MLVLLVLVLLALVRSCSDSWSGSGSCRLFGLSASCRPYLFTPSLFVSFRLFFWSCVIAVEGWDQNITPPEVDTHSCTMGVFLPVGDEAGVVESSPLPRLFSLPLAGKLAWVVGTGSPAGREGSNDADGAPDQEGRI